MKPIVAFALGIAVAGGTALMFMSRDRAPEPVKAEAAPVTASAPVVPAAPAPVVQPAPAPVVETPSKPSPAPVARVRPRERRQPVHVAQNTAPPAPATAPVQTPSPAVQTPAPAVTPATPPAISEPARPVVENPTPRLPHMVTVPAGTLLPVRLGEGLSTDRNEVGDTFTATLDQALVIDGFVIAERGARVKGRVVESLKPGRVKGLAQLGVELTEIRTSDNQQIAIATESFRKAGAQSKGEDAAKVGAAAGIGAAIGAIAGGGKGAAIGAAIGGAGGAGTVMATRGKDAELPVETRISFKLREPVNITEKLR